MKTKNELILDKLVELGYVETNIQAVYFKIFNPDLCDSDFIRVLNALISECWKRDLEIVIKDGQIIIDHLFMDIDYIHAGVFGRKSVAEAFCKVTGIE